MHQTSYRMLTKLDKEQFRGIIFRHLDGIATATTAYCLHKNGVLQYLLNNKKTSIENLSKEFKANEGYLQCWLTCIILPRLVRT